MAKDSTDLIVQPQQQLVRAVASPVELAGALQEYRKLQGALDEAMPESVMKIRGKLFRKKAYWRAVKTAFNLEVTCLSEKMEKGEKDWGYVVMYRATAPNGSSADGDGACFASEKSGVMRTVHNVRSHAHTRAFNRAVSNLVGFGEVSVEELDFNGKDGTQHTEIIGNSTNQNASEKKSEEDDKPSAREKITALAREKGISQVTLEAYCREQHLDEFAAMPMETLRQVYQDVRDEVIAEWEANDYGKGTDIDKDSQLSMEI